MQPIGLQAFCMSCCLQGLPGSSPLGILSLWPLSTQVYLLGLSAL